MLALAGRLRAAPRSAARLSAVRWLSAAAYKPDIEAIKQLRAASDAPVSDVKSALEATQGDVDAAFEWLRKKGIARAGAKAGRLALQGLVGVYTSGTTGAMVEINCETDFVAVNDYFQRLTEQVSKALATTDAGNGGALQTALDSDALKQLRVGDAEVAAIIPEIVGKVGENIVARRAVKFHVDQGAIFTYLHNKVAPQLGRSGAMVALQYAAPKLTREQAKTINELGAHLAMHVVAGRPRYLSRETVPAEVAKKERELIAAQVKELGKPAHIQTKMIDGRLNKFYGELTLLEQDHLIEDGNPKVGEHIQKVAKQIGVDIKVAAYERYDVGEKAAGE